MRETQDLWKNDAWILHEVIAPIHNTPICDAIFSEQAHSALERPYSPDHSPSDFYLFPKVRNALKQKHFLSVREVKNDIERNYELQHCFEQ